MTSSSINEYHNMDGNNSCADCSTKKTEWVSFINVPPGRPANDTQKFTSFICRECAMIHQSITKVNDRLITSVQKIDTSFVEKKEGKIFSYCYGMYYTLD